MDPKQEKFERLAEKRVTGVMQSLKQIGHLANKSSYMYTEDHVDQIFAAIERETSQVRKLYEKQDASEAPEFAFSKKTATEEEISAGE